MSKEKKDKELEFLLKAHPMADSPIVINEKSQKSLEEIDDKTLITLVGDNLYNFTLITVREKALQTELRRRKKAIPPHFLRYVIGCCHEQTVDDEDLFNLKESNKSAVKISKES
jgi:hypothetical protein